MVTPAAKKRTVTRLDNAHHLSERTACWLAGVSRTAYRYQPVVRDNQALRSRLKQLATDYPRYGYLMLHGLLKTEGLVVNAVVLSRGKGHIQKICQPVSALILWCSRRR